MYMYMYQESEGWHTELWDNAMEWGVKLEQVSDAALGLTIPRSTCKEVLKMESILWKSKASLWHVLQQQGPSKECCDLEYSSMMGLPRGRGEQHRETAYIGSSWRKIKRLESQYS